MKYAISFLLGALMIMTLDMIWAQKGYAKEPKACIDPVTQEIIYVPAGMPCPGRTTEY